MKSFRVLFLEDEEGIRSLVKDFLSVYTSIELDLAKDGLEGIKKANSKDYDVILSDIKMPNFSGNEFVKLLREEGERNQDTPILIASAFIEDFFSDLSKFKKIFFLSKPYHCQELLLHLCQVYKNDSGVAFSKEYQKNKEINFSNSYFKILLAGKLKIESKTEIKEVDCSWESSEIEIIDCRTVDKIITLKSSIIADI